jgi:hypothetical protein
MEGGFSATSDDTAKDNFSATSEETMNGGYSATSADTLEDVYSATSDLIEDMNAQGANTRVEKSPNMTGGFNFMSLFNSREASPQQASHVNEASPVRANEYQHIVHVEEPANAKDDSLFNNAVFGETLLNVKNNISGGYSATSTDKASKIDMPSQNIEQTVSKQEVVYSATSEYIGMERKDEVKEENAPIFSDTTVSVVDKLANLDEMVGGRKKTVTDEKKAPLTSLSSHSVVVHNKRDKESDVSANEMSPESHSASSSSSDSKKVKNTRVIKQSSASISSISGLSSSSSSYDIGDKKHTKQRAHNSERLNEASKKVILSSIKKTTSDSLNSDAFVAYSDKKQNSAMGAKNRKNNFYTSEDSTNLFTTDSNSGYWNTLKRRNKLLS